jgi:hypothetical protein
MVIMTTVKAGWPSRGRSTRRSVPMPNRVMTTMVIRKASQNGRPATVIAVRPTKPPIIIMSPWAKLTVSVAL